MCKYLIYFVFHTIRTSITLRMLHMCNKAVDKWVLGGAEAPPNFGHLYL